MPYRLVIQVGDRLLHMPLRVGELVLGANADCDLRVSHPTVSRRHARLVVGEDGIHVVDLGSSNGTAIDGRRLNGSTMVSFGQTLRFGSVEAVLEEIEADDIEAAIALSPDPGVAPVRDAADGTPSSTVGPAALEAFSLQRLPELAERVARGDSTVEVAQAVGGALYHSLPCRCVIVRDGGSSDPALLFAAERSGADQVVTVSEPAGDGRVLEVGFPTPGLARAYEPLVQASAALIRAAGRGVRPTLAAEPRPTPPEPPSPPSVVPAVQAVYAQAARIAASRVSVLIRGESGTGKELLARYLHTASERAAAPLVTLNCAALPRDLLEAELFGVERGVATGVEARAGRFEAADGGTLFLDEIGDMAPETQARILRVLQENEVYRIGGHHAHPARVRVISATNRDLEAMLADGRFRRDLFHRIADWVVELPPLRARRADIPNLAAHFLARACAERGVRAAGISRAALEALESYDWPGNIRQLEKEIGRAALFLEDSELLDLGRLQPAIVASRHQPSPATLKEALERAERELIERALEECGGSIADAARHLGLGLSTLYRRLKVLGIETV